MGKIKRITIILGKSCNLKCKYCIQHSTKNTIKDSPNINPDIYSFIEKFSKKNSLTIRFFGGEPLLYFDKIKEIVENTINLNVNYEIVTNGTILSKEKIKYLNDNNVLCIISWDGDKSIYTRGYDVIKERRQDILEIKNLMISSVISNMLYPFDIINNFDRFDHIYYKIHHKHCKFGIDILEIFDNCEENISMIDYQRIKKEYYTVFSQYLNGSKNSIINQLCSGWLAGLSHPYSDKPEAPCRNGYEIIPIDLAGNMYYCDSNNITKGTIHDSIEIYRNITKEIDSHIYTPEICRTCVGYFICRGGCRLVRSSSQDILNKNCRLKRSIGSGIIQAILDFQAVQVKRKGHNNV